MRNLAMFPCSALPCTACGCPMRWGFRRTWSCSCADRARLPPRAPQGPGRPATRARLVADPPAVAVRQVGRTLPPAAWRVVSWRNGRQPRRRARFAAVRVTPAHDWRQGKLVPEVWLLIEEEAGRAGRL